MGNFICIETSTKSCSLALSQDGKVIFDRICLTPSSHAALLGVYALEAMEHARKYGLKIDAVAVSSGPGSYTGLRIGVSLAKGLCYGMDIPLIAVPTLKIMARRGIEALKQNTSGTNPLYFCPMIDARRMEVYAAVYDENLCMIREIQADIVDENTYRDYLSEGIVVFFGDGSGKCKSLISSPNAFFFEGIYPAATAIVPFAGEAFNRKEWVDTAYFEPFYLKEFQATVAKNKLVQ
jgi:tRNA threonylcarbamoyladenosine biosynthesis protein TsaB